MKNICWYAICQIYKKRATSLLTTLMLAVTISVIFYTFLGQNFQEYPLRQASELLADDASCVYKLEYHMMIAPVLPEELSELAAFYDKLNELDELQKCGMYSDNYNYEMGVDELYVQEGLSGLCRLKTVSGAPVELGTVEGYGTAYVGCELADIYPKGSVYETATGERYIIKDVLQKNARWLPCVPGQEVKDIDTSVLLDYDYLMEYQPGAMFNGISCYYYVTGDESAHSRIVQLAGQYGLEFYGAFDLESKYNRLKRDIIRDNVESVLMPVVMYIAAVMTIILVAVKSLADNRSDYGIMLANGMTKRQITAIVITESVCKMVAAGLIAALYWSINIEKQGVFFSEHVIVSSVVATVWVCIATLLLANIVPFLLVRRYRLSDML